MDVNALDWDGSWNTRDLGGMRAASGQTVRRGALIRSGNLARLSAAGKAAVLEAGVGCVVDLRSGFELQLEANPFADSSLYCHAPLMSDDEAAATAVTNALNPLEMYVVMLEMYRANIAAVLRAIADAPDGAGVVVHCHAGKDRTGLIVALLLGLMGVSPDDIADDYARSDAHLQAQYAQWLEAQRDLDERAKLAVQLTADRETMLGVLEFLNMQHGGVNKYLEACGLDATTLGRLQWRLLNA